MLVLSYHAMFRDIAKLKKWHQSSILNFIPVSFVMCYPCMTTSILFKSDAKAIRQGFKDNDQKRVMRAGHFGFFLQQLSWVLLV